MCRWAAGPNAGSGARASRLASVSAAAPAVEISGLVKRYGRTTAVDGLSLRAERGTVTAVLGPNGAGKTTTIEICEGYRRCDGGTVRVLGLDPVADARELRPKVGVMLQAGGIPPTVRAGEYLRVLARFYARPIEPAVLLGWLGLTGCVRTPFKRLSGGPQAPGSLARAPRDRPPGPFFPCRPPRRPCPASPARHLGSDRQPAGRRHQRDPHHALH